MIRNIYLLDTDIVYRTSNKLKTNVNHAINHYNSQVYDKHKITLDEVYHDLDMINMLSYIDVDDLMEQNIDEIQKLLIENNVKNCTEQQNINESKQNDMDIEYDNYIDIYMFTINKKLKQKNLIYSVESKIFHDLYRKSDIESKIRMNSRRSAKAMSFLNDFRGIDYKKELEMNNMEFNVLLRYLYGIKIIPTERPCNLCGYTCDVKGKHSLQCRMGKEHHFRHNEMNKYLYNVIQTEYQQVRYEKKPFGQKENDKPDIIFDEYIKLSDGTYHKAYLDLVIVDVYRTAVVNKYKIGDIGHFCAGKLGVKDKLRDYNDKFENLNVKNYKFVPIAMESFGGISKNIKLIIDNVMELKSKRTKKDKETLKANYYIKFSMKYMKLLIKSIFNHYQLVN